MIIKDRQIQLETILDDLLRSWFACLAKQYEVCILSYRQCRVEVRYEHHLVVEIHLHYQVPQIFGLIPPDQSFPLVYMTETVEAYYCCVVRVFINGNRHYPEWNHRHILIAYNVQPFFSVVNPCIHV